MKAREAEKLKKLIEKIFKPPVEVVFEVKDMNLNCYSKTKCFNNSKIFI